MSNHHFVGWLGKLPAVGDFVSRGLDQDLQNTLYQWISQGMRTLSSQAPEDWQQAYLVTPVWHFAINAGIWNIHAVQGCFAPSLDKIGRYSPLLIARSFDSNDLNEVLPPRDDWTYRVDEHLRRVVRERLPVEDVLSGINQPFSGEHSREFAYSAAEILNDLGIGEGEDEKRKKRWFSWPGLAGLFTERNYRSFWWAEPSLKQPPRQIIHSGKPDEDLFVLLMGGGLFVHGI